MRRRRLVVAGAVGAATASLGGLGSLRPVQAQDRAAAAAPVRVLPVVARRFVFLPDEITLKRGEPVELAFTAPEVVMGFFVPELNLRTVIVPGEVARLRFVPDRVGRFDFLCDIFCGEGHEGMSGHLTVTA